MPRSSACPARHSCGERSERDGRRRQRVAERTGADARSRRGGLPRPCRPGLRSAPHHRRRARRTLPGDGTGRVRAQVPLQLDRRAGASGGGRRPGRRRAGHDHPQPLRRRPQPTRGRGRSAAGRAHRLVPDGLGGQRAARGAEGGRAREGAGLGRVRAVPARHRPRVRGCAGGRRAGRAPSGGARGARRDRAQRPRPLHGSSRPRRDLPARRGRGGAGHPRRRSDAPGVPLAVDRPGRPGRARRDGRADGARVHDAPHGQGDVGERLRGDPRGRPRADGMGDGSRPDRQSARRGRARLDGRRLSRRRLHRRGDPDHGGREHASRRGRRHRSRRDGAGLRPRASRPRRAPDAGPAGQRRILRRRPRHGGGRARGRLGLLARVGRLRARVAAADGGRPPGRRDDRAGARRAMRRSSGASRPWMRPVGGRGGRRARQGTAAPIASAIPTGTACRSTTRAGTTSPPASESRH